MGRNRYKKDNSYLLLKELPGFITPEDADSEEFEEYLEKVFTYLHARASSAAPKVVEDTTMCFYCDDTGYLYEGKECYGCIGAFCEDPV